LKPVQCISQMLILMGVVKGVLITTGNWFCQEMLPKGQHWPTKL